MKSSGVGVTVVAPAWKRMPIRRTRSGGEAVKVMVRLAPAGTTSARCGWTRLSDDRRTSHWPAVSTWRGRMKFRLRVSLSRLSRRLPFRAGSIVSGAWARIAVPRPLDPTRRTRMTPLTVTGSGPPTLR